MDKTATSIAVDQEIEKLGRRLGELPKGKKGRRRRCPDELQVEAVELWRRSGLTKIGFGKRLGVSGAAISFWSRKKRPRWSGQSKKDPGFSELNILNDRAKAMNTGTNLTLELGNGARVCGLSLEDLKWLLKEGVRG